MNTNIPINTDGNIITGTVVHGDKIGRTLGFPTANLNLEQNNNKFDELKNLTTGIYVCMAYLPKLKPLGLGLKLGFEPMTYEKNINTRLLINSPEFGSLFPYPGLLHYGKRSTFNDEIVQWEVYLLDFDYEIYGQEMRVFIGSKLRDTVKFSSVDALIEQMKQDELDGRKIFFTGN